MLKKLIHFFIPTSILKKRILKNLIIFTMIPLLMISVYAYFFTYQKNTKEYSDNIKGRLDECSGLINAALVGYIDKSSYIIENPYLVKNIQMDYRNAFEQMMNFSDNINAMIGESFSSNTKSPYTIYTYNETLYFSKFIYRIEKEEEYALAERIKNLPATDIVWIDGATSKNSKRYLTFYRNIVDFKTSVGMLEVNIPYSVIEAYMDNIGLPAKGLIFSENKTGDVLHFNNQSSVEIESPISVNSKNFITVSNVLKNGHTITAAIPKKELHLKNIGTLSMLFVLFIAYILVVLIASRISVQRITGSLEGFINKLKQDENLLLNEELIKIKGTDEVFIIKQKFKELVSRMNEIYKEMMNVKLENSSLERELLQSRINPHLLYNSLSVIKWNALWNKDQKTVDMIDAMTLYYRTALNKGNSIISISSELEMIKEYVKINIFAHSVEYRLEIEVEERVLSFYTLKHLLQPVVENSILHGLNGKSGDAGIKIKGYMEGDDIIFMVRDNGRGMERETIESILNMEYVASYGGYGIKNLIRRIQLYYGSPYGIEIESKVGEGTIVTIRIEALNEDELKARRKSTMKFN